MAWVPISEAGLEHIFSTPYPDRVSITDSIISGYSSYFGDEGQVRWTIQAPGGGLSLRVRSVYYTGSEEQFTQAFFQYTDPNGDFQYVNNEADPPTVFIPEEFEAEVMAGEYLYYYGSERDDFSEISEFFVEVWIGDGPGPGPDPEPTTASRFDVYELDKGWTFDGNYIPHYAILNWYFGDNPTVYKTMQKVRVHGLAKGEVRLQIQTNGIQTDYREDFSSPEHLDLSNPEGFVVEDFEPATNYADLANRGLAIQVKFEGRNTDLTQPEPAHVLQVLIPQSSPEGSGFSSN